MIITERIETPENLKIAHQIRHEVFVIGQNCPPELEYEFEEESKHFLASVLGTPAGTARWRETDKGIKLERFAVLEQFRGMAVGKKLLFAVLEDCPKDGRMIYLHAQLTAADFYAKYGFEPIGQNFWEAGIEHVKMKFVGG
jgi:predicted GNAT family N-acyltransferase